MWGMGRFRRFHCEWLSAPEWLGRVFLVQIQERLLRRQLLEQVVLPDRSVEESVGTQQHGRIGQQAMQQVKCRLLKNTWLNPSWFFS